MFHLELRQFPHVARAFNLSREELDRRFARPWVTGIEIEHDDRRWAPAKAKLVIYEGRSWASRSSASGAAGPRWARTALEVTETVLAEAGRDAEGRSTLEVVKAAVRGAARTPLALPEVIAMIGADYPSWRPSEQLAMAEQAVWELLHQGICCLRGPDGPIESERWSEILLSWRTWTGDGAGATTVPRLSIRSTPDR